MLDTNYLDLSGDLLSEMRLLVEGAITRYEDDLTALITPPPNWRSPMPTLP